jgi:hypothetical protein
MIAILTGVRWNLSVVLICISLVFALISTFSSLVLLIFVFSGFFVCVAKGLSIVLILLTFSLTPHSYLISVNLLDCLQISSN